MKRTVTAFISKTATLLLAIIICLSSFTICGNAANRFYSPSTTMRYYDTIDPSFRYDYVITNIVDYGGAEDDGEDFHASVFSSYSLSYGSLLYNLTKQTYIDIEIMDGEDREHNCSVYATVYYSDTTGESVSVSEADFDINSEYGIETLDAFHYIMAYDTRFHNPDGSVVVFCMSNNSNILISGTRPNN